MAPGQGVSKAPSESLARVQQAACTEIVLLDQFVGAGDQSWREIETYGVLLPNPCAAPKCPPLTYASKCS